MPPPRILPPAHRRHDRFRLLVAVLAAGALVHLDVRHLDLHLHAGERLAGEPQRSGPRPTAASATRSVLLLLVVVEEEAADAAAVAVVAVAVAAVRRCRPRAPPSPVPDRHAASPLTEDPPPPRSRSAVGVGEGRRRPRPLRPAHARSGFVVPRALPARLAPVGRVREPDVLVVVVVEDVGHARAHAHASKLAPGVQLCASVSVVVRVVRVVGVVEVLGAAEARVVVERGFPRGAQEPALGLRVHDGVYVYVFFVFVVGDGIFHVARRLIVPRLLASLARRGDVLRERLGVDEHVAGVIVFRHRGQEGLGRRGTRGGVVLAALGDA